MNVPGMAHWRILVVDDDPLVCESIQWMLRLDGHEVATALTGQAGIDQLRTGKFDAVVLDYRLPDIDGDQVAAAMQSLGERQPILIVTAYAETVAPLGKVPGTDYLVMAKPFSMDELRQAICNIISKR